MRVKGYLRGGGISETQMGHDVLPGFLHHGQERLHRSTRVDVRDALGGVAQELIGICLVAQV